jgi:hypothetical protein
MSTFSESMRAKAINLPIAAIGNVLILEHGYARATFRRAHQKRPAGAHRIQYGANIIHSRFQRRHTRNPIGEALTALVETYDVREARQPLHVPAVGR